MTLTGFYLASPFLCSVRILSAHTSDKSNFSLFFIPARQGNYVLGNKLNSVPFYTWPTEFSVLLARIFM